MVDQKVKKHIETTDKKMASQNVQNCNISVNRELGQAINDYLLWMISKGYSHKTLESYEHILKSFLLFISSKEKSWNEIFTLNTLKDFQKNRKNAGAAVRGLSKYLFKQKRIPQPIHKQCRKLPDLYEDYLTYYAKIRQVRHIQVVRVKRVLSAFHDYLERLKIKLYSIKIEDVDAFMTEFNKEFSPQTKRIYRTYLRGFLGYLYQERKILKRNLAPLVRGAPIFAKSKPPKFLRPQEVQKLFASLRLSSAKDIRTCAMVHLAYFLGLRSVEISKISLDDISFSKAELTLRDRKSNNPMKLPIPEHTIKAVAAYMVGARPDSKHRALFLSFHPPRGPLSPGVIGHYITACMRQVGLSSSAYWLRHTSPFKVVIDYFFLLAISRAVET